MLAGTMSLEGFHFGPLVKTGEIEVEGADEIRPENDMEVDSKRPGGRDWNELRSLFMKTGVVSRAAGSAYLEAQKSKVMCSVFGPMAPIASKAENVDRARLYCELKWTRFAKPGARPADGQRRRTDDEEQMAGAVTAALESLVRTDRYPKTTIEVYVLILEDDGSTLSAALTCACLALADAQIELYGLMAGCSVADVAGRLVLDPTRAEEQAAMGLVSAAYLASSATMSALHQTGQLGHARMDEAVKLCTSGAGQVVNLMRAVLKKQDAKARKRAMQLEQ